MIIHLNGFPGVGKMTIAKIVAKELDAHVLDDFTLTKLVYVATDRNSPQYVAFLRDLTNVVYAHLGMADPSGLVILTNALATTYPEDKDRFKQVQELSETRGDSFVPIQIVCSPEEAMRRAELSNRHDKQKLTDPAALGNILNKSALIHPTDHPNQLTLDVTDLVAEQAADEVVAHIKKIQAAGGK